MALAEALGSDGTLSIWTSRALRLVLMSRARTDSDLHVEKHYFPFPNARQLLAKTWTLASEDSLRVSFSCRKKNLP